MWRDGLAGRSLQKSMVDVAARRLFQHAVLEQHGKPIVSSGAAWAAFARLAGPPGYHVDSAMERLFDTKDHWTDSIKALNRFAFLTGA